ncbi:hypothetical protein HOK021_14900 [Streptomyces hygroscopicus]|nr:hypothetical protein HOK021_14900 [Streptomyces hygroscopicus]
MVRARCSVDASRARSGPWRRSHRRPVLPRNLHVWPLGVGAIGAELSQQSARFRRTDLRRSGNATAGEADPPGPTVGRGADTLAWADGDTMVGLDVDLLRH